MNTSSFSKRILLVEDQSELRFVFALWLSSQGYEVIPAIGGKDALNLFRDYKGEFAMVLTDFEMPLVDGLALVQALREAQFEGRIIVMSGNMPPEKEEKFRQYDIAGFLLKPFEMGELAKLLDSGKPNAADK